MRAVIVDDERKARNSLKILLETFAPDLEIIGEADGVVAAYEMITRLRPALVFLDIEMPPSNGFDLLEKFDERAFDVIFTTAYSEYGIKAIKAEALDYVLKPVIAEELVEAVERARRRRDLKEEKEGRKISLSDNSGVSFVHVNDILWCESDKNYTTVYLASSEKKVVSKTLKEFEEVLVPHGFLRVHHSNLVNLNAVEKYHKADGGTLELSDGSEVMVSRRKREGLFQRLKSLRLIEL